MWIWLDDWAPTPTCLNLVWGFRCFWICCFFTTIYHCRLPQWGLVRSVCPVQWSRCSLSSFHVSWRVSLVSPSDLCPVEICSQPAWQVGRLLIFVSVKITKSARENNVLFFVLLWMYVCYVCAESLISRVFHPIFFLFSDRGIIMTFGSGSNGCLGHGNFNDVTQVHVTLFSRQYTTVQYCTALYIWKLIGDFLKLHKIGCTSINLANFLFFLLII